MSDAEPGSAYPHLWKDFTRFWAKMDQGINVFLKSVEAIALLQCFDQAILEMNVFKVCSISFSFNIRPFS